MTGGFTAGVCRRITIGSGSSETGPRLGGRAPDIGLPTGSALRYFFTIPLGDFGDSEISVYLNHDDDFVFGESTGQLYTGPDVEVVRHAPSRRRGAPSQHDSHLSEHPLMIGEERADWQFQEGRTVPDHSHKLGASPYFIQGEPDLEDPVANLMNHGFVHLVQVDFPGNEGDASVKGSWPVGDGMFHVLARYDEESFEWACFWER